MSSAELNYAAVPVPPQPLSRVFKTWWPLAASWLLMTVEQPAVSAIIARLATPTVNLAAWGSVVYPLSLIIESPIIMLLAASTALSQDWASYLRLRRFMMWTSALLTIIHALVAFTPLYDVVVGRLIGAPAALMAPARIGLQWMLPWTWSIAYRRFHQGILIRCGRSRAIGLGTVVRLTADGLVLAVGYVLRWPGTVVAGAAIAAGVITEALYVGVMVQPVLRGPLHAAPPVTPALTWRAFGAFYVPLMLTSLLQLLVRPLGSAALSRMPEALASLAVWPVVASLIFMLQSMGTAYNEVVVALLDEPQTAPALRRFAGLLIVATSTLLLLVAATPLAGFWFARVSALPPELAARAQRAVWLGLPMPAFTVLQSWFQGHLLHRRHTRGITESVALYLVVSNVLLWAGVAWQGMGGLTVGLTAFTVGATVQIAWLWLRARQEQSSGSSDL